MEIELKYSDIHAFENIVGKKFRPFCHGPKALINHLCLPYISLQYHR